MEEDKFMEELCGEYEAEKDNLIQMLNSIQEHYGYIPQEAQ